MDIENGNECAYPILETETGIEFHQGMTKREAFAMAAMQGLAAGDTDNRATHEDLAIGSVIMADALLKELSNES